MAKFIDLTGQKFGKLTAMNYVSKNNSTRAHWKCQCDCGNITITSGQNLRNGKSKSCGCARNEHIAHLKLTHNKSHSPEYQTWNDMIKRCTNPNNKSFKNYGGRGITIYEKWRKSFYEFYNYIGNRPTPKHTIERINNNLGYIPGNIKWATCKEQNNNRRSNHQITFNGETMNVSQWAKKLGIKRATLNSRIVLMNWPIEKALNKQIY